MISSMRLVDVTDAMRKRFHEDSFQWQDYCAACLDSGVNPLTSDLQVAVPTMTFGLFWSAVARGDYVAASYRGVIPVDWFANDDLGRSPFFLKFHIIKIS